MKLLENLSEHKNKFTVVITLAAAIGLLLGVIDSLAFIISNKYLEHKMYYLTVYWFTAIINKYLLIALVVAALASIFLILMEAFLKYIGINRKLSSIIIYLLVPSILIFIIGGYYINKQYPPGIFQWKSIIGNAIWVLACVSIGWLIFKASQMRFISSGRIYSLKIFVTIICLVIGLNAARYFFFQALESDRAGIILISIDTLRADHLSCYGYNRKTSPNIDRFAEDGLLFKNTIAQSSFTLPSHMSMLTGLYPTSHGVLSKYTKLNNERLTLVEILQNAGYETAAITDGGFVSQKYGYQGFDLFDDKGKGIEAIYKKAVNWLRKNHSRPFFLFLHTYQPHTPYDPPPIYDIYSDKNYRGIVDVSAGTRSKYYQSIKSQMTLKDYLYVIDKYDGEIYYTDHFLGKLFKEIKDLRLYDRSIIVITSDHGEHFLEHTDSPIGYIGHFELYDEVVKVPLLIKAPGFPKNKIIDEQVESIDIMPAVVELLGISIPHEIDGEGLVELVKKGSHQKVYSFSERFLPSPYEYEERRIIRGNDWKLLLRSGDNSGTSEIELYNLQIDPEEKVNLIAKEAELSRFLFAELQAWMDTQAEKSNLFPADEIKLDDELKEQLKALGYMN